MTRRPKDSFDRQAMSSLCRELTELLNDRLPRRACGVHLQQIIQGARKVCLASLTHQDKVQVRGNRILLDRRYVSTAYDASDERRRAVCALYFLHELIHLAQGIGPKSMVRLLRRAEGEQTLLHFDLHADHVAAMILHRARPQWSLQFLKDVQGHALCDFPATHRHSLVAQRRKRMRVLAVRADYWARRIGLIDEERVGDGYLFLEYTRPRGSMLLFRSGPPLSLLGEVRLGVRDVSAIERVNFPAAPLPQSKLDEILLRALRRLRPCPL
jgi:hypothetical protein